MDGRTVEDIASPEDLTGRLIQLAGRCHGREARYARIFCQLGVRISGVVPFGPGCPAAVAMSASRSAISAKAPSRMIAAGHIRTAATILPRWVKTPPHELATSTRRWAYGRSRRQRRQRGLHIALQFTRSWSRGRYWPLFAVVRRTWLGGRHSRHCTLAKGWGQVGLLGFAIMAARYVILDEDFQYTNGLLAKTEE